MQNYLTQKVGEAGGEFTKRIKDKASHSSLLCFSHVTNSQHCKFRPSDKGGGEGGAHPDPEVRWGGGGGGGSQKTFIQPFGPQFRLKVRGHPPPGFLPWIRHLVFKQSHPWRKKVFSQTYLIGVVRAGYKSKQLCQGIGCRKGYLPFFCTCRWN